MHRGALREGCVLREGKHCPCVAKTLLRVGAGQTAGEINSSSGSPSLDALTHGQDLACAIGSGGVGKWWFFRVCTGAHVHIDGIDAGGIDFDDDLAGASFGIWNFFEL